MLHLPALVCEGIETYHSTYLVQELHSETNAEFRGQQIDSSFAEAITAGILTIRRRLRLRLGHINGNFPIKSNLLNSATSFFFWS